jgi:hypothetical protein
VLFYKGEILINLFINMNSNDLEIKKMKKTSMLKGALAFVTLSVFSITVFAADGATGVINRGIETANAATVLVIAASALIGLALLVAGGLQLKKYSEDPRQTPLSKPLIFIIAGALIFGLSATSETMTTSIFGGSEKDPDVFSKGFE